jgi:hypothetical protein
MTFYTFPGQDEQNEQDDLSLSRFNPGVGGGVCCMALQGTGRSQYQRLKLELDFHPASIVLVRFMHGAETVISGQ